MQALAVPVVGAYAFLVTFTMAKLIDKIAGFRVSAEDETTGVDLALHAETAYEHGVLGHATPLGDAIPTGDAAPVRRSPADDLR